MFSYIQTTTFVDNDISAVLKYFILSPPYCDLDIILINCAALV